LHSNAPAPLVLYTLSLHDALPILSALDDHARTHFQVQCMAEVGAIQPEYTRLVGGEGHRFGFLRIHDELNVIVRNRDAMAQIFRSEEHTSELQSRENLVCRLLLEK